MEDLLENDAFLAGIAAGISLYERGAVLAYETGKPLEIGRNTYHIRDSTETLSELLELICK